MSDPISSGAEPGQDKLAALRDCRDALRVLLIRTAAAQRCFAELRKSAGPEIRSVAQDLHDLHAAQAEEIARIRAAIGGTADTSALPEGAIDRTIAALLSLDGKTDGQGLSAIRTAEDHILDAFDAAVSATPDGNGRRSLDRMRQNLAALLIETRYSDRG